MKRATENLLLGTIKIVFGASFFYFSATQLYFSIYFNV